METKSRKTHNVLIVDDDLSLRRAVAVNVQVGGYDVIEAADGLDALEVLTNRDDIDLVICDVVMPRMNGADFIEKARAIRPHLPFIMITGYSANELMTKSLRNGAFTVLPKPFDPRTLLTVIKRAITSPVVLVVDSEESARSVATILESCHIRVREAASVADAAEAVRQNNFDVVIVDAGLRELEPLADMMKTRPDIRVIGLVAGEFPASPRSLTPMFTYLRKPVEADRLMQVLATARATP